jgi:hypothetical protein
MLGGAEAPISTPRRGARRRSAPPPDQPWTGLEAGKDVDGGDADDRDEEDEEEREREAAKGRGRGSGGPGRAGPGLGKEGARWQG